MTFDKDISTMPNSSDDQERAIETAKTAIVVTSIAAPNEVLRAIAREAAARNMKFYVMGDTKSPSDFYIAGCDFYSLSRQQGLTFRSAQLCPTRHYARKNIGYLQAIQDGACVIIETDDDNMPRAEFYQPLDVYQTIPALSNTGWVNVYRYYSDLHIWPRGLPLDAIAQSLPQLPPSRAVHCPIQQGLADDNPDVDAIYRLLLPLSVTFKSPLRIALDKNAWCPFNSQNTVFYKQAFPLLYLPAYCSFRMTDIWRSFVAQRIAWENGWSILFREATVDQSRNDHSLMKDFEDEIPGYLHNRNICKILSELPLAPGRDNIPENMKRCYEAMVTNGWVGGQELELLTAWLDDLDNLLPDLREGQ